MSNALKKPMWSRLMEVMTWSHIVYIVIIIQWLAQEQILCWNWCSCFLIYKFLDVFIFNHNIHVLNIRWRPRRENYMIFQYWIQYTLFYHCFIAPHRCCGFYKLKVRTSKKIDILYCHICFILLVWSHTCYISEVCLPTCIILPTMERLLITASPSFE